MSVTLVHAAAAPIGIEMGAPEAVAAVTKDTMGICPVASPFVSPKIQSYAPSTFPQATLNDYLRFGSAATDNQRAPIKKELRDQLVQACLKKIKPDTHPADRAILLHRARDLALRKVEGYWIDPTRRNEDAEELLYKEMLACEEAATASNDRAEKFQWLQRGAGLIPSLTQIAKQQFFHDYDHGYRRDHSMLIRQSIAAMQIWRQIGDLLSNKQFLLSKSLVQEVFYEQAGAVFPSERSQNLPLPQEYLAAIAYAQAGKFAKLTAWEQYDSTKQESETGQTYDRSELLWQLSHTQAFDLFGKAIAITKTILENNESLFKAPVSAEFQLLQCPKQDKAVTEAFLERQCQLQEEIADLESSRWHIQHLVNYFSKNGKEASTKSLHEARLKAAKRHEELSHSTHYRGWHQIKHSQLLAAAARFAPSLKETSELYARAYEVANATRHRDVVCPPHGNNVCGPNYLSDLHTRKEESRRMYVQAVLRQKQASSGSLLTRLKRSLFG
jgi:hypothetical protein